MPEPDTDHTALESKEESSFEWWPHKQLSRAVFAGFLAFVFFYSAGGGSESGFGTLFCLGFTFLAGTGVRYLLFLNDPQSASARQCDLAQIPIWKSPTAIVVFVGSLMAFLFFSNRVVSFSNQLARVDQAITATSDGSGSLLTSAIKVGGGFIQDGPGGALSTALKEYSAHSDEQKSQQAQKEFLNAYKKALVQAKDQADTTSSYALVLLIGLGGYAGAKYGAYRLELRRSQAQSKL